MEGAEDAGEDTAELAVLGASDGDAWDGGSAGGWFAA
jgi:hypothetical protein